jgi:pectate disaccharide-lyase
MPHAPRRSRRWWAVATAAGLSGITAAAVLGLSPAAHAATLFSDDFQSGLASSWSKSGGTWAVVSDGSQVLQESSATSDLARDFNGSTGWTDYSLQAQVKATAFGSSDGLVGISARTASSSKFYRLALTSGGQAVLQAYAGSSAITTLGSSPIGASTGTWYTLRLDVVGTTITGFVNGTQVARATDTMASSGRISMQTFHASGEFDNVTVSDSGGSTPTATSASPTPSRTSTSPTPSPSKSTSPTPTPTSSGGTSSTLYAAPTGSDSAAGTLSAPTTLASAVTRIAAGGTIYLRGGTYNLATTVTVAAGNNGTSSAYKTISPYAGEKPVLDFSAMAEDPANRGLALDGNYWHVSGITVQHAGDNGIFIGGSNNIVERVVTAFNRDSGLQISRIASDTPTSQWPANNLVLSSESHDNMDSAGENADGFAAKLTAGPGNVFRYDVSHNNIDDGWDLYTKSDTGPIGVVTIEYSLSYNNGKLTDGTVNAAGDRNGFKLGGEKIAVNHVVQHDIAVGNGHDGFTYNSNPGDMTVSNNVSVDNAERNFHWETGNSVFRTDTSCRFTVSGSNDKVVGSTDSSDQFWSGTNGSRCSSYSGSLGWSFAADGHLVVTFGGVVANP